MVDTEFFNSYIGTDAELESMIGGDKRASAIALKAASAADQEWYCQEATRRIDALPLRGHRYEELYIENGIQKDLNSDGLAQSLEFPRVIDGIICDYDHGTQLPMVPALVKRACLEEAIAILSSDGRRALQEQGVQSYQIPGIISETFRAGSGKESLQSAQARQIMRRYVGAEVR